MDNRKPINETPQLKYQVVLNGTVLNEAPSQPLAEQFLMSLSEDQRHKAKIVPVTEGGQHLLFG